MQAEDKQCAVSLLFEESNVNANANVSGYVYVYVVVASVRPKQLQELIELRQIEPDFTLFLLLFFRSALLLF